MEKTMIEKLEENEQIEDLKRDIGVILSELSGLRSEVDKLRRKIAWMEIELGRRGIDVD